MKHVKDHRMLDSDGDPSYLIRIFEGHTVDGVIYVGEFKIYKIMHSHNGVDQLRRAGGGSGMAWAPMTAIADAEVLIHGSVKSSGCSNWWIDNGRATGDTAIHHCFADDLRTLLATIACAHDLAAAVPTTGDVPESWS